jgi:hypothetical protein
MSGCYPSEQVKNCNHGNENSSQCHMCGIESILNYASLNNRIEALHCNKLQQIDLNKKAEKKFEELEKKINEIALDIESHYEASIEDNEYADDQIRSKFKEIDDLKSKFADFMQKSGLNCEKVENKRLVCSGCRGKGFHKYSHDHIHCKACDGKGFICI